MHSLLINIEEGIIVEPLNLTVSLRCSREIRDKCQLFHLTGLLDAFSEPTFRRILSGKIDEGRAYNFKSFTNRFCG